MLFAAGRQKSGGLTAERLLVLRNKPPKWNEQLGAYCLNFRGRVTQPSVKNFQLAAEDDLERVLLQFGKACMHGPTPCMDAGSVACRHATTCIAFPAATTAAAPQMP